MFKINKEPVVINRFPDGTPRLNIDVNSRYISIEWLYEQDEEMMLMFIVRHLREKYDVEQIKLIMPYIPHARMDRVKNPNEVFTLKYFCEFINSMNFDTVVVKDAHSNVSLALLNNFVHCNMQSAISQVIKKTNPDIIFYPDEGSHKRYSELMKRRSIFGIKNRDWNTGEILGLDIHGDIPTKKFNVLIIDDISSYGGTFYHSAKKLKELGADKIYLYITHCENSILDGELIKSGLLEKIYTTKSIFTKQHDLIEIIGGETNE